MPNDDPEPSSSRKFGGLNPGALFAQALSLPGPASRGWTHPTVEELQRALPQYEIVALVGRGGMGAVYKAWQKSLDRHVAIKVVPSGAEGDEAGYAIRFQREAKAMARLSHPGILAVHDAGETRDGLLYIVMDFVEGTDVQKLVAERGRLPAPEAVAITASVCEALAYAHRQGVIHRDIKPSNIMIEPDGHVKVADFGLAKVEVAETEALTGSDHAVGTRDFIAPEAVTGAANVDQRADLYAVGVMLYQMLTGTIPRGRFDPPSRLVPGLDRKLDGIVDRTLQADREARYSSAAELRRALAPILECTEMKSTSSQPVRIGWKIGLAAAAMLVAAAVAFQIVHRPSTPPKPSSDSPRIATAEEKIDGFSAATKDAPFVNTLGMKFVPVPIIGGRTSRQRVLFSVWETRVQDYREFVNETKREWPPTFPQTPAHPAVNVSWEDAQAFCTWLTARERKAGKLGDGESYRLPTDHEWSCAVGIGTREDAAMMPEEKSKKNTGEFPWGSQWPPPPGAGNFAGEELRAEFASGRHAGTLKSLVPGWRDPFVFTAPVGSMEVNSLGLFDLAGNVREWCEDWMNMDQKSRVLRGGSWCSGDPDTLCSDRRYSHEPTKRYYMNGFRCVLAKTSP